MGVFNRGAATIRVVLEEVLAAAVALGRLMLRGARSVVDHILRLLKVGVVAAVSRTFRSSKILLVMMVSGSGVVGVGLPHEGGRIVYLAAAQKLFFSFLEVLNRD